MTAGDTSDRHIVLVGPMGIGKTTLGRSLARRLGRPFVDNDKAILARRGQTGREIAETQGVRELHALEAQVVLDQLAGDTPSVIGAAGSVIERPEVRNALSDATVVWLDGPPRLVVERAAKGGGHRRELPLREAEELDRRRRKLYAAAADVHLDALRPPQDLLVDVVNALDPEAPSESG